MATTLMILDQKTSKKATLPEKYGTWFWLKLQKKAFFSLFLGLLAITRGRVIFQAKFIEFEQKWTNLSAAQVWSPLIFFLLGASEVWNFVGPKMSSFEQIWKLYSKTVIISHTNLFKNAILGSTQLLATTLMKLD